MNTFCDYHWKAFSFPSVLQTESFVPSSTSKSMSNTNLGFLNAWHMPLAFGNVSIPKLYFNTLRLLFLPFLETSIFRIHVFWQEYTCRPQRGNDILNSEIMKKKLNDQWVFFFFYSNDYHFLRIPSWYWALWTWLLFSFSHYWGNRQTKILHMLSLQLTVLIDIHIVKEPTTMQLHKISINSHSYHYHEYYLYWPIHVLFMVLCGIKEWKEKIIFEHTEHFYVSIKRKRSN